MFSNFLSVNKVPIEVELSSYFSSENTDSARKTFEKLVLKELQILKAQQNQTGGTIETLLKMVASKPTESVADYTHLETLTEHLPISTEEDLCFVESVLADERFADEFVNFLSLIGGTSYDHGIKLMLRKIITDDFAVHFSYLGKREKREFKGLRTCQTIHRTVRKNEKWRNCTEVQIDKSIANWLRHAKARSDSSKSKVTSVNIIHVRQDQ